MNTNARFPGWGSGQVTILLEYALSKGLSTKHILEGSGITLESLEHTDPSLDQELYVINRLIDCIPSHPFRIGFGVGLDCNANSFGLMGQALLACKTPKGIIQFASQHLNGELNFSIIRPRIYKSSVRTTFDYREGLSERASAFILGRDMGSAIAFQETLYNEIPDVVMEVGFRGKALPGMEEVGEYYRCPVKFEQRDNYLMHHIRIMDIVLPLGNQLMEKILSKRIQKFVDQLPDLQTIKAKTQRYFEQNGYQDLSKEELAKAMNMSSRTLTRYLTKEGTNWRKLSNQLRMDRAKEYLINTHEGVEQIAFKVGFASASSFSSAFSREVGRSPLEYRLTHSWNETLEAS